MKTKQLGVFVLVFASCLHSPQAIEESGEFSAGFTKMFEVYEAKCPYFAHKGIDWKELGYTYYPLVAGCSTEHEFIEMITPMLAELQDPFIMITRYNDEGEVVEEIHPFTKGFGFNYDMDVLVERYLEPNGWAGWEDGYVQGFGWCDPSVFPYVFVDTIPDSKEFEQALNSLDAFVAECVKLNLPAIIVDVRMNPSGNAENQWGSCGLSFTGRFTKKSRPGAVYRSRSGLEYDLYEDRRPAVYPAGPKQYTGTVIVLVGERCISSTENMLANFINFPNVVLVGDTTGGSVSSGSEVSVAEYYTCGVVETTVLTCGKHWIESTGLPPDILVEAAQADFAAGVDPVLNYAMGMLEGYSQ
jgi:hypothetical protein